jgi:hypothetical protein
LDEIFHDWSLVSVLSNSSEALPALSSPPTSKLNGEDCPMIHSELQGSVRVAMWERIEMRISETRRFLAQLP